MTDLRITRGDDVPVSVAVTGAGDIDLTTAQSITFTAKRSVLAPDEDALIRKESPDIDVVDETHATVSIDAADTRDLAAPVVLVWDLEVVDEDGRTHTVASGTVLIDADVTRVAGASS